MTSNAAGQVGSNAFETGLQTAVESDTGINASYTTASRELTSGAAIQTSSTQQTNEYLSQTATGIYNDPNPQIVRRPATGGPVTYQQRILVRFLQPPAVPPPGVIEFMFTPSIMICNYFISAIDYQRSTSAPTASTTATGRPSTCTSSTNTTSTDFTRASTSPTGSDC